MKKWQVTGVNIFGAQFIPLLQENTDRKHQGARSVWLIISIY